MILKFNVNVIILEAIRSEGISDILSYFESVLYIWRLEHLRLRFERDCWHELKA